MKLRKYSVISNIIKSFVFGFLIQNAWALDAQTISELHPPVLVSIAHQKVSIFFLKNNLRDSATYPHVAGAEVFYSSVVANKPSFNYVWKIEGDEIASIFFYDWTSPEKKGTSMYVLTKSHLSTAEFEGVTYSTMEFPILKDGTNVVVSFFPKDLPDAALQNCNEGRNLISGMPISCAYKNASDIKKYLVSQDKLK